MTKTNYDSTDLFAYGINEFTYSETREEDAIKAIRNKRNNHIFIEMPGCQSLSCTRLSPYRWEVEITTKLPYQANKRKTEFKRKAEMDSYELEDWVRAYAGGPCTAKVY